eukprot:scaffold1978_cov381-Prasinococcus_capsulatus_cf.AAC.18
MGGPLRGCLAAEREEVAEEQCEHQARRREVPRVQNHPSLERYCVFGNDEPYRGSQCTAEPQNGAHRHSNLCPRGQPPLCLPCAGRRGVRAALKRRGTGKSHHAGLQASAALPGHTRQTLKDAMPERVVALTSGVGRSIPGADRTHQERGRQKSGQEARAVVPAEEERASQAPPFRQGAYSDARSRSAADAHPPERRNEPRDPPDPGLEGPEGEVDDADRVLGHHPLVAQHVEAQVRVHARLQPLQAACACAHTGARPPRTSQLRGAPRSSSSSSSRTLRGGDEGGSGGARVGQQGRVAELGEVGVEEALVPAGVRLQLLHPAQHVCAQRPRLASASAAAQQREGQRPPQRLRAAKHRTSRSKGGAQRGPVGWLTLEELAAGGQRHDARVEAVGMLEVGAEAAASEGLAHPPAHHQRVRVQVHHCAKDDAPARGDGC